MKLIPLSKGKFAKVSDHRYDELMRWKWHFDGRYAARNISFGKRMRMHVQIMNTPKDMQTDHINGDRLDNQDENLRICTISQNTMNRHIRADNKSGYKGVAFYKRDGNWQVEISVLKKRVFVGRYKTSLDAALAYDEAAKKYHGEFANLNFPNKKE